MNKIIFLFLLSVLSIFFAPPTIAASNFSNTHSSQKWVVVNTYQSWTKKIFAIGPHEWTVNYKKDGIDFATENWKAPDIFTCHKNPLDCRPAGVNGGNGNRYNQWFWGIGYEVDLSGLSIPDYEVTDARDYLLSTTNCGRGIGSAILWEPNCQGTTSYYSTGPYGWTLGALDGLPERNGPVQAGIQVPLRWEVRGFYSTVPPPINQ